MTEHGFYSYNFNIGDRWFYFQGNASNISAWCHPTAIAKDFFYLKSWNLTINNGSRGYLVAREDDIIMISDIRVDYNTKMWSNLEELLASGLTHRQIMEFIEL